MNKALVTKLQESVDNTNLPVLTPFGLKPYLIGRYINRLYEQGYTLSEGQETAIGQFLEDIGELSDVVLQYWPFIGSSNNTAAAKVPLLGDKNMEFPNGFNAFRFNDDNNIIGLTSFPSVGSVTAGDLCTDASLVLGASFIRNAVTLSGITIPAKIFGSSASGVQLRVHQPQASGSTSSGMSIYAPTITPSTLFNTPSVPSDYNTNGNTYVCLGLGNRATEPYYCRYARQNNGAPVKMAASDIAANVSFSALNEQQKNTPLLAENYSNTGVINALTGFVAFGRVLNNNEMTRWFNAMKALNVAFGKEVEV